MAAVRATRSALPSMLAAKAGVIISVCSVNARLPDPAVLDYSVAKAGLAAFSKALAKEVGPQGIRVNTVSPGPVATDLWLGAGGVAQTVGAATGAQPADVARQAASQLVTGGSPSRPRSPGWCCSRPATGRATSPEPTSPSTVGWFRPGSQGRARRPPIGHPLVIAAVG
jgi:NAD(P)-dependent dehydrogenase (short-subunit alcohol dehydrogenase family)